MAFRVRSRDNHRDDDSHDGDRWLMWDDHTWTADPETTALLQVPNFSFPLTPTGPVQRGIGPSTSELLAAAMYVIPAAQAVGDVPPYPRLPDLPRGAIT